MPDDKEQLWTQAGQRLASGQRDDGRRFYRVFIQRFPQDPRAPQAYLAIGMSFVQESKYPNAAAEFQKVLNTYPSSPEVPEAMWQLSLAFVQLHFCTDARAAADRPGQALPQVAARRRRQGRAEVDRQAAPLGLHQLAPPGRVDASSGGAKAAATWRPARRRIGARCATAEMTPARRRARRRHLRARW